MKNNYEIRGECTVIFLKRKDGTILETLINTFDLEKVISFKGTWHARFDEKLQKFYVRGNVSIGSGKQKTIIMHRFITECEKGFVVDHVNHDTLNNTRNNLRKVTHAQNMQNREGAMKNNKLGIRGVCYNKSKNKYEAYINIEGNSLYLGKFDSAKEAEKVATDARKKLMPFSKENNNEAI